MKRIRGTESSRAADCNDACSVPDSTRASCLEEGHQSDPSFPTRVLQSERGTQSWHGTPVFRRPWEDSGDPNNSPPGPRGQDGVNYRHEIPENAVAKTHVHKHLKSNPADLKVCMMVQVEKTSKTFVDTSSPAGRQEPSQCPQSFPPHRDQRSTKSVNTDAHGSRDPSLALQRDPLHDDSDSIDEMLRVCARQSLDTSWRTSPVCRSAVVAVLFLLATGANLSLFGLGVLQLFNQVAGVITVATICLLLVAEAYASCVAIALATDRIRAIRVCIASDEPHPHKLPGKHCRSLTVALSPLTLFGKPGFPGWDLRRKSDARCSGFAHSDERVPSRNPSTTVVPVVRNQKQEKGNRGIEAFQEALETERHEQNRSAVDTDTRICEANDATEPSGLRSLEGISPLSSEVARSMHDEGREKGRHVLPTELCSITSGQQLSHSLAWQATAGCEDHHGEETKIDLCQQSRFDQQTLCSSGPKCGTQRHHNFEKKQTKSTGFDARTNDREDKPLPHVRLAAFYKRCRWCNRVVDKSSRHSFRLATCVGHHNRKSNIAQVALRLIRVSFLFLCAAAAWTKSLFYPDAAAAAYAEARRHFPVAMDVPTVSRCCLVATLSVNICLVLYLLHVLTKLLCIHQSTKRADKLQTASATNSGKVCPTCSTTIPSSHCRAAASFPGYTLTGLPSTHPSPVTNCSTASIECTDLKQHANRHHLSRMCLHSPTANAHKCGGNQTHQGFTSFHQPGRRTAYTCASGDESIDFPGCCRGWTEPRFATQLSTEHQVQLAHSLAVRAPESIPKDCISVKASHPYQSFNAGKMQEGPRQVRGGSRVADDGVPLKRPSAFVTLEPALQRVLPLLSLPDISPPSAKHYYFHEGPAHRSSVYQLNVHKQSQVMQTFGVLQSGNEADNRKGEEEKSLRSPPLQEKHLQPKPSDGACSPKRLGTDHARTAHTGDLVGGGRYSRSRNQSPSTIRSSECGNPPKVGVAVEVCQGRNDQQRDEGFADLPGVTDDKQGTSLLPTLSTTTLAHVLYIPDANASTSGQGNRECELPCPLLKSAWPTDPVLAVNKAEKEKTALCLRSRKQSPNFFDTLSSSPIPSERPNGEEREDIHLINELCTGSEYLPFSLETVCSHHDQVVRESRSSLSGHQQLGLSKSTGTLENYSDSRIDSSFRMAEAFQHGSVDPTTTPLNVLPGFPRKTHNEAGDSGPLHFHRHNQNECELVVSDNPDVNMTAWMKLHRLRELLACIQLRQKQRLRHEHACVDSPGLMMKPRSTQVAIQAPPQVSSFVAQGDDKLLASCSVSIS